MEIKLYHHALLVRIIKRRQVFALGDAIELDWKVECDGKEQEVTITRINLTLEQEAE